MNLIGLEGKARCMDGYVEHYWFENEHTGLSRTLFHRIVIPIHPFDSGLDYVSQPETTEIVVEWINLGLDDPSALAGVVVRQGRPAGMESSLYLGGAHNWYRIRRLTLTGEGRWYRVSCTGTVEFSREGVARDERFTFQAIAMDRGLAG